MHLSSRAVIRSSGILYVLAWIIGLSSGGPSIDLDASGAQVVHAFNGAKLGATLQFGFAEGLAGLMLLVLVAAACRKPHRAFVMAGTLAGLISLVMCGLGLYLIRHVAPSGDVAYSATLNNLVNRLDGPKMWLLAALAISANRMIPELPRWVRVLGYALAAALIVSGIAYGLLLESLAWSAYVSGLLLLVWALVFVFHVRPKSVRND